MLLERRARGRRSSPACPAAARDRARWRWRPWTRHRSLCTFLRRLALPSRSGRGGTRPRSPPAGSRSTCRGRRRRACRTRSTRLPAGACSARSRSTRRAPARDRRRPGPSRTARARRARCRSGRRRSATRGCRSAAALFATCRVRCATGSVAARNRSICARAKSGSVSAVARCVITPTTSRAGAGSSATAPPAHAGVELHVHGDAFGDLAARDDQLQPGLARLGDLRSDAAGPRTRIRAAGSSARRSERLADGRDAQSLRARLERGAGAVDRAVAVGVGLHDRPDLGAAGCAQQRLHVAPQRSPGRS